MADLAAQTLPLSIRRLLAHNDAGDSELAPLGSRRRAATATVPGGTTQTTAPTPPAGDSHPTTARAGTGARKPSGRSKSTPAAKRSRLSGTPPARRRPSALATAAAGKHGNLAHASATATAAAPSSAPSSAATIDSGDTAYRASSPLPHSPAPASNRAPPPVSPTTTATTTSTARLLPATPPSRGRRKGPSQPSKTQFRRPDRRRRPGRRSKDQSPTDADEAPPTPSPTPGRLGPKLWVLMSGATHRRFVKLLPPGAYAYKQYCPAPRWLRQKLLPFTVRVQRPGELVVTAGHSHYVVSGNSVGFSWSHADPQTLERLVLSDRRHGSRQADGKPNTFSAHFHRSPELMEALRANLEAADSPWRLGSPATRQALVAATQIDQQHTAWLLDQGWRAEEVPPVLCPTAAQFANPLWYTAMMQHYGRRDGSLQIRIPDELRSAQAVVPHSSSTALYRLAVVSKASDTDLTRVKILRPEAHGFSQDSGLAQTQQTFDIPVSPEALGEFLHRLHFLKTPLLYSPQCAITAEQLECLHKALPAWALPLSCVDGMRSIFRNPATGTTTPTFFGGRGCGITGLHDEYNHTVSLFYYPPNDLVDCELAGSQEDPSQAPAPDSAPNSPAGEI